MAIALASGRKVRKLLMKTFKDATSPEHLAYIGTHDDEETLRFHADLFLNAISSIAEIDDYHHSCHSFPWRIICILSDPLRFETMDDMRQEWGFVVGFVDCLKATHVLHKMLQHTRYQFYRDAFIKAEFFDFDAARLAEKCSLPFRKTAEAMAGLTSQESSPMLTSLASELAFNDLRDASKRHCKAERANGANLHAVAIKSAETRSGGSATIPLDDSDWAADFKGQTVKARVHSALRATDKELGVSCEGLTRHRVNHCYTKPHVFCQRLRLLKVLKNEWQRLQGSSEDKHDKLLLKCKETWTSKVIPLHAFVQWKSEPDEVKRALVLSAGPFALRLLPLQLLEGTDPPAFAADLKHFSRDETLVGPLDGVEVALTRPALMPDSTLAWVHATDWMSLTYYVAHHAILETPAGILTSICSFMKLRGHGKLNHKKRVELFLKEMQVDAQRIQEVLDELPEHEPKKRKEETP
ncbi:unnamed protein product [Symbiodinium sp. CCMP2592]|nr:unnamed protein product [Symbiodinium sp. CCMP2592]